MPDRQRDRCGRRPEGQPAGYKFSESLATLKPGDTIGLAVGMSFESITVKSIERTGDRLVIEPEKELTVEGRTKKRLEFQLVGGYWIEADVLAKIQPAAAAPAETGLGSLPPWALWAGGGALLVVAALVVFLLIGELGPLLRLDQWIMNISPYVHVPRLPGAQLTATPLLALTALTAALIAAGLYGLRRRDIGQR